MRWFLADGSTAVSQEGGAVESSKPSLVRQEPVREKEGGEGGEAALHGPGQWHSSARLGLQQRWF